MSLFRQINLHKYNTILFCLQVLLTGWSFKSILSGNADFTSQYFLVILLNKIFIFYIYSFSGMNGFIICILVVIILYVLYFLLQFIAWLHARSNRLQRGTLGLPDLDTSQAPRTYWGMFGDFCYSFLLLCCRIFPQNQVSNPFINYSCGN